MHIKTHTLPSSWAPYLINEDLLFADVNDQNDCFTFLTEQNLEPSQLISASGRFIGMSNYDLKIQEVCVYAFRTAK